MRCRTTRENQSHAKTYGPQPPHRQGTLHRRLQLLYAEKRKVSCSGFLPNPSPMQQPCSHYNTFCSSRYISMQRLHGDLHPRVAEQQGRTSHTPKHTVRNRRTDKVPVIAACSHFTRKNTRFRAPASSPTQVHATFMEPLQCVLQQQVHIHAAMSLRFASTRCRTPRGNQSHVKANGPQPPHRRGTCFIAACSHFAQKTSQGFVFRLPPQHKPHATFMQPLQCVLQHHVANTHLFTHMAIKHDKNSHHPK